VKRILAIVVALIASFVILVVGGAAGGDDGNYEIRAIFDNASFLVTGEDVRVAGAKIGSVAEVDITTADEPAREDGGPAPGKAAVTLRIDDPAFQDFRADASCLIRPQSLIGEKFVECKPTEPRAPGTPAPPALEQIADGEPGAGQYLLPLERNGKAVDLDLVNNIMRQPYPDRFRLILNDLGAGLAARGDDLAEIVERSNPALRETNKVLAILRQQNRALASLATDGDAVVSALARERESVAGFVNSSAVVGEATAERRADLEAGFAKLPGFLRELRSTMDELTRFSDAAIPVFSTLGQAAPSLTRLNRDTIPFSAAGTKAVTSLGDSAERTGPALAGSDPVIQKIRALANDTAPATKSLSKLLASLRKTNGFQYFLKTIYGLGGTVNGFDQFGHLVRALIPVNNCFDYTSIPQAGCSANFADATVSGAAAKSERSRDRAGRRNPEPANRSQAQDQQQQKPPPAGAETVPETAPQSPPGDEPQAPGLDTEPAPSAPDAAPDETAPDGGGVEVQPQAARRMLDFLVGEPDDRRRGRR
jgi:phospholipid/cholesterol/gamma-HCH transport system substrate-binding protein